MALSLDELIDLVERRSRGTAVDPQTMKDYEEAKFLKEQEGRSNARIAENAGIPPDAVKGMSRRDVQRLVEKMRTAKYEKESAGLEKKFGVSERDLAAKLQEAGAGRTDEEFRREAFNDPNSLNARADEMERLLFPRGRKFSDRPNVQELGAKVDMLREMANTGPKSADVTAQRAAARLPEFDALSTTESEEMMRKEMERGTMSAAEAATIRAALKPKAALEEEEIMARLRPGAENAARATDVFQAANDLMAPLSEATKLTLPEVRARKRLATEIQKRGVDPMDLGKSRNPRALPLSQRTTNPAGPGTVVNPDGTMPNNADLAENELDAMMNAPDDHSTFPVIPTPYDLVTGPRSKRRTNNGDIEDMFL